MTIISDHPKGVQEPILLVIGTKNPAKIDAVREVASCYALFSGAAITAHHVSSGVSEQPTSLEETIRGAINRAKEAFTRETAARRMGVGIESGIFPVPYATSGWMDIGVCAFFDGTRHYLGTTSAFEYPPAILPLVFDDGLSISQAAHRLGYTTHPNLGHNRGMIGLLTKDRITRKTLTKQAVINALIHLENPHLYG